MNLETLRLLQDYRDKAYISNLLCELSCSYYSVVRQVINTPIILCSSIMTVLNSSSFSDNELRVANIVVNFCTTLLLSISINFKITEKISSFRTSGIKFIKLCHVIDDKLLHDDDEISKDVIKQMIVDYDAIYESLDYTFPSHIKKKLKIKYYGKKALPNILDCETVFIDTDKGKKNISEMAVRKSSISDEITCDSVNTQLNGIQVISDEIQSPDTIWTSNYTLVSPVFINK